MKNQIKSYEWGHHSHIPKLLDLNWPEKKPAAEVWMGAHPSTPSMIYDTENWIALNEWIDSNPNLVLGHAIAAKYGGLPFLFKLLAAGKSLSIQAHPNKMAAETGFAEENAQNISLTASHRNYKDNNHKPEILMALTPFTAMSGFRKPSVIAKNFQPLLQGRKEACWSESIMIQLENSQESAIRFFLQHLLTLSGTECIAITQKAVSLASSSPPISWDRIQCDWIGRLAKQFPGDIGILAPLYLNVILLHPGQALYQAAGELHAYLEGFGVELMANSDNVLRGGLTPKNVDVSELLHILNFHCDPPCILEVSEQAGKDRSPCYFPTSAGEFSLGFGSVESVAGKVLHLLHGEGPLIILNTGGSLTLSDSKTNLLLPPGHSAFIPHIAPDVSIEGDGCVAIAKIGI